MLGKWLRAQFAEFKKGELDQARQGRLESPSGLWGPLEAQQERNLGLLSAFHARKGHADEPFRNDEERVNLMKWFMRKCQDFNHSGKPRFGHSASGKHTR
jgi:hypothetical protein